MAARVPSRGPDRACLRTRGQATVELALMLPLVVFALLVILGAAALATLLITWASKSHAITKLFDTVIGKVLG